MAARLKLSPVRYARRNTKGNILTEEIPLKEGWISILNSRKYHYVVDKMTLCNKFMYLGEDFQKWDGETFNKNDCAACVKKLKKSG